LVALLSVAVWRIVSLEKINDRSFEDRERTLEELKSFFFNTLYHWTTSFVFPLVLSFNDFLVLFSLLARCFFCILLVYLGALYAFNYDYLLKKKKKISCSLCVREFLLFVA
jgi:hypothetical protein